MNIQASLIILSLSKDVLLGAVCGVAANEEPLRFAALV